MTMEPGMTPIRLLVVDDHNLFRRGLIALLAQDSRFSVAGEAADASEAQRSASRLQPDVILLDNHLPGVSGIDAIGGLKAAAPQARVVMLTVSENEEDLAAGLRAGADGYLAMAVFALWLGLSYGGIVSLMPALCMDLFGARAVSAIIGTLYTGAAFGNLLGPWVAGAVFDAQRSYAPVIWGCMVLSALATAATWQLVGRQPAAAAKTAAAR